MASYRLPIVLLILLLCGGGAAALVVINDGSFLSSLGFSGDSGSGPTGVRSADPLIAERTADREAREGGGSNSPAPGNASGATRRNARPGDPDREPDQPDADPKPGTNDSVREKLSGRLGDAVTREASTPQPSVAPSSPESVTAPAERKPLDRGTMIRNMLGDPAGLTQSRQGHIAPRKRALKQPEEGTVPPASSGLIPGLLGEYFALDKDPREMIRYGEDPSAGDPTFTRLDQTVHFPNRNAFNVPFSDQNFVARWRGYIKAPAAGAYYLGLGSDCGGGVAIDGQVVLLNDVMWWYIESWALVELTEGWHRIDITHVEAVQPDDDNRNTACVFMMKPEWGVDPVPVPSTWLGAPTNVPIPEIKSVLPAEVEVGNQITITGVNLVPADAATANAEHGADGNLMGSWSHVEVRVDSVPAKIFSKTPDRIVAEVPPGAGTGVVEVVRYRYPSNPFPIKVKTRFGLRVSVWDLTGYPKDLAVADQRPPDDTFVLEEVFPLTRERLPEWDGKPIVVKVEGEMARSADAGSHNLFHHRIDVEAEDAIITHHHAYGAGWGLHTQGVVGKFVMDPDVGELALTPETGWLLGSAGVGPPGLLGAYELTDGKNWAGFSLQLLLAESPSTPCNAALFVIDPFHSTPRTSHFRPGVPLPAQPRLALAAATPEKPALPTVNGRPSVKVGQQVRLAVSLPQGAKLDGVTFSVDGVAAPHVLEGAAKLTVTTGSKGSHVVSTVQTVAVTVPDGCGSGVLRARQGIVLSNPLLLDIADRGLTGFYYDYDTPLTNIPDNAAKQPSVRRVDKHLEFQNGTDFALPFPAERFAVDWYGSVRIPEDGVYTFIFQSDDGARIKIDGQTVCEFSALRPPARTEGKITLTAGWHDIHLQFYENDILENFVVWWVRPGSSSLEKIPLRHLSTAYSAGIPAKWPSGQAPVSG